MGSFYLFLVGSKVALAVAVGKSRRWTGGKRYLWIMRILGILLCLLAAGLAAEGIALLSS